VCSWTVSIIFEGSLKLKEWEGKFEDRFNWEVGNGRDILFWSDNWVASGVLKNKFMRLFSLSILKEAYLCDFGSWVNGVKEWNLMWIRVFFLLGRVIK